MFPNETLIKLAIGVGAIVLLVIAFNLATAHYISVGRNEVLKEIEQAKADEALRQAGAKANALQDAANRVAALTDLDKAMSGALNNSEVLNHAEIDSPCLSVARRLRINAIH